MNGRITLALLLVMALAIGGLALTGQKVQATDMNLDGSALTVSTSAASEDGDEAKSEIKGSDKKGKYWFKKTCKTCHGKDSEGGELTPMSKTIKQWQRVFDKDRHFKTDEKTESLSESFEAEQLIHIKTFLINHAADSDQPETCG